MVDRDDANRDAGEDLTDDVGVAQRVDRNLGRVLLCGLRHAPEQPRVVGLSPGLTARLHQQRGDRRAICHQRVELCGEPGRYRYRVAHDLLRALALA